MTRAGEVTFIPTRCGWLHLVALIDLYSRRIAGWSMSERNDQQLVKDALLMAVAARRPSTGLIHHTDQGQTYASAQYRALLKAHGIVQSMSRKGNCLDNAVAESFLTNH